MFEKMRLIINRLVRPHQSNLERYINSKHPKSPADVENIIMEYDSKQAKGNYYEKIYS